MATADFFTPVVDDARTFGRIAAANALSDVYAVGGEPLVALNLLGWPRDVLSADLAAEVLPAAWRSPAGWLPRGRRPQHRRSRAEVRHGGDRAGRPRPAAADRRRPARPAAVADQADRHRDTERDAQGDRRGQRGRDRGDDHAERGGEPGRARRGHPLRDRRHRFRAARARLQARQGERRYRRDRPPGGAADRGSAAGQRAGHLPGGSRRNLAWVAPHADFGALCPTRCCCSSPTRRPRAACWSPERFPAPRSSASWCRAATSVISVT